MRKVAQSTRRLGARLIALLKLRCLDECSRVACFTNSHQVALLSFMNAWGPRSSSAEFLAGDHTSGLSWQG